MNVSQHDDAVADALRAFREDEDVRLVMKFVDSEWAT